MTLDTSRSIITIVKLVRLDFTMALRSVITSKLPVVIILGATGTGKTKLSIELAQKFGTEVISADSMQIYKGLDIVTAKASQREREIVPHHLLDILEPHQMFTVVDFRNRSLKIMDTLIEKGKIPIVVGGTNYYIESIVYQILVENMDDDKALLWDKSRRKRDFEDEDVEKELKTKRVATNPNKNQSTSSVADEAGEEQLETSKDKIKDIFDNDKNYTNEEVHMALKTIDPEMASRLHLNNRRKVLRSLEVWLKSGRRHSEVLAEQAQSEGKLRNPDATIIFWLTCDKAEHEDRLNKRVDSMLEQGLIAELLDFHDRHNKQRIKDDKPPDYTKGIFQTLGFKEFHDYLMIKEEEKNTEIGKKLLEQSIDNMKMATRRYAKRQNKMIRGRFLEHPNREVPPIWTLNTTDISRWNEEVKIKAISVIESFLKGTSCPYEPLNLEVDVEKRNINSKSNNYCEVCKRTIIGDKEFRIHLSSNRHSKVLKKMKRLKQLSKTQE